LSSRRGRRRTTSRTVYDSTAIPRPFEAKWNPPPLSARDANAHPMLDCFDFRSPAFLAPPVLPAAPPPTGAAACIAADPTAQ
jgi:hypothetical protein